MIAYLNRDGDVNVCLNDECQIINGILWWNHWESCTFFNSDMDIPPMYIPQCIAEIVKPEIPVYFAFEEDENGPVRICSGSSNGNGPGEVAFGHDFREYDGGKLKVGDITVFGQYTLDFVEGSSEPRLGETKRYRIIVLK